MSKNDRMVGISRRTLVKSTAIGSLALAAGGFSLPFTLRSAAAAVQQASEKVIWGACSVNCGSRCALRLHVKAGGRFRKYGHIHIRANPPYTTYR